MRHRLILLLVCASLLPSVQAAFMRLDFSGTIVGTLPIDGGSPIGGFSGYYVLDTLAFDTDDSPMRGRYAQALVGGSVNWNGFEADLLDGFIVAGVDNDSGETFYDTFSLASITSSGTSFFFILRDETETVFSDDSFPTQLSLLDFDPFEIDNANSTGVTANFGSGIFQGSIDFISYTPVPLPGALVLFSSALMGIVAYARRRNSAVQCDR